MGMHGSTLYASLCNLHRYPDIACGRLNGEHEERVQETLGVAALVWLVRSLQGSLPLLAVDCSARRLRCPAASSSPFAIWSRPRRARTSPVVFLPHSLSRRRCIRWTRLCLCWSETRPTLARTRQPLPRPRTVFSSPSSPTSTLVRLAQCIAGPTNPTIPPLHHSRVDRMRPQLRRGRRGRVTQEEGKGVPRCSPSRATIRIGVRTRMMRRRICMVRSARTGAGCSLEWE